MVNETCSLIYHYSGCLLKIQGHSPKCVTVHVNRVNISNQAKQVSANSLNSVCKCLLFHVSRKASCQNTARPCTLSISCSLKAEIEPLHMGLKKVGHKNSKV